MSEMAERVARELCRQENVRPELWQHYSSQALGILKAMREPTPEMVASALPRIQNPTQDQRTIGAAAAKMLDGDQPVAVTLAAEMARDWQAMIDAALAENSHG